MADLNALIAQGVQFKAPPDPFAQYAQMQQLQQGATQNQLAQYQLGAAQRADVQSNALNAAYAGNLDPNTGAINYGGVARSLAGSGAGSQIPAAMKSQFEQQQAQTKLIKDKLELLPGMYQRADTPEAYATLQNMVHSDPVLGPWLDSQGATKEKGIASLQNAVSTGKFNDLRIGSMQSVAQILDSMKPVVTAAGASVFDPRTQTFIGTAPEKTPPPPAMVAEFNFAKTPEGGNFRGTYQDFVTARAAAGRAPALPRPEQPPVAVVDPVTGKQVFVSREEALKNRMTPASALEGLAPKEIQRREAVFPQATSSVKATEENSDKLITQLESLRDHKGLSGITGLVYGNTPALTREARNASTILENIMSKGTLGVLTALRASSKTGAALGNASDRDILLLKSAFGALKTSQNTDDFKKQINEVIADLQTTKSRAREEYTNTYSYRDAAPAAAPTGSIHDQADAILRGQ